MVFEILVSVWFSYTKAVNPLPVASSDAFVQS